MSALWSLGDMAARLRHVRLTPNSGHQTAVLRVRFVPIATECSAAKSEALFRHLVDGKGLATGLFRTRFIELSVP